jgi:hypothetical protein
VTDGGASIRSRPDYAELIGQWTALTWAFTRTSA